ncbi:hypothetical protein K469DRAFT_656960 [Zopfia rhizophila CBS 207.26]|uniref:Thioesterase domain-containing protein n=1 Tax=Zopfia rhizophila CBS 207.26 TaxID=1314779 RepID=A0A6A6EIL8_9PEZI|nr:hypothetical protein K469DRAFT_656960 [Zopfia rhizophila CBS 207.26]
MLAPRPHSSLPLLKYAARPLLHRRHPSPSIARLNSTSPPARFRLSYLWYGFCLAFGIGTGYAVRSFAAPPPLPKPGSREDQLALDALRSDVDALEIVKTLRAEGYHLHSDTPLKESGKGKGGWRELDIKTDIAKTTNNENKITRTLTQQSMAGAQGLVVQRAFWNSETRELVAVVWFGGALCGWPGLAHGGAIATAFDEVFSRVVVGPDSSLDSIPSPLSLSVTYARPTQTLNFYILRTSFSTPDIPQAAPAPEPIPKSWLPSWKDFTKKSVTADPEPTVQLSGTLETVDQKVCVKAKASFPASAVHISKR